MTVIEDVNALSDDQALLLQWVNTILDAGVYREYPRMAELVAITVYQLTQEIPPGDLRRQLDAILVDLRTTIRTMHDLLERRTH